MRASGPAPRRWSSARASRSASSSSASDSARAASYGRPRRATRRPLRASRRRAGATTARRRRGEVLHDPVLASPVRELAEPPRAGAVPLRRQYRRSVASRAFAGAARAMRPPPARTPEAACQPGSVAAAAIVARLREAAEPVSGSPRRARTSASTSSAWRRGSGESRISATITSGGRRSHPSRPRDRARSRTRRESRASRQRSSSRPSQCASPASIQRSACSFDRDGPARARGWTWHERRAGAAGARRASWRSPLQRSRVSGPEQLDGREVIEPSMRFSLSPNRRASSTVRFAHADHGLVVAAVRGERAIAPVASASNRLSGRRRARRSSGWRPPRPRSEAAARQIGHETAPCGGLADRQSRLAGAARSPARARRSPRPGRP